MNLNIHIWHFSSFLSTFYYHSCAFYKQTAQRQFTIIYLRRKSSISPLPGNASNSSMLAVRFFFCIAVFAIFPIFFFFFFFICLNSPASLKCIICNREKDLLLLFCAWIPIYSPFLGTCVCVCVCVWQRSNYLTWHSTAHPLAVAALQAACPSRKTHILIYMYINEMKNNTSWYLIAKDICICV